MTADNPAARVDLDALAGEVARELGGCPFNEQVNDASMCRCGMPALDHEENMIRTVLGDHPATARLLAERDHWRSHAEEAGRGFERACRDYARVSAARTIAEAERDEARAALVAVERSVGMQGYRFCSRECHGEALTIVRAALADPEAS
jgi:hypothetical protein